MHLSADNTIIQQLIIIFFISKITSNSPHPLAHLKKKKECEKS